MNSKFFRDIPIISEEHILNIFTLLKANVVRSRKTISVVLISVLQQERYNPDQQMELTQQMYNHLKAKLRQTDVLFQLDRLLEWGVILSHSGEEEAKAFIQRLYEEMKRTGVAGEFGDPFPFVAAIAEIGNNDIEFDDLMNESRQALSEAASWPGGPIGFVRSGKRRKAERIKVSILESNEIFKDIFRMSLQNLRFDDIQLDIRDFRDGLEFLDSDWYGSSHTHIVITNDILPRKNGMEVVYALRQMPNNGKFIVFMMTKRNAEEDMIAAYESGVDHYIVKPFNIRLFESQLKRVLVRLWS
ncbi:response regulator [Paenibacillus kobensis]|uniref:response regulator n=1 Tax=Paenibacillus kobensis TaxID=59841 RepID=UPI000FD9F356|nr:response regulator [Paenibacillus kobensis]